MDKITQGVICELIYWAIENEIDLKAQTSLNVICNLTELSQPGILICHCNFYFQGVFINGRRTTLTHSARLENISHLKCWTRRMQDASNSPVVIRTGNVSNMKGAMSSVHLCYVIVTHWLTHCSLLPFFAGLARHTMEHGVEHLNATSRNSLATGCICMKGAQ